MSLKRCLCAAVFVFTSVGAQSVSETCSAKATEGGCTSVGDSHEHTEHGRVVEFYGPPHQRDDKWIRFTASAISSGDAPPSVSDLLQRALQSMKTVLTDQNLFEAWQGISSAAAAEPDSAIVQEIRAYFVWRYYPLLTTVTDMTTNAKTVEKAIAGIPGLDFVRAVLGFVQGGKKQAEGMRSLQVAHVARPNDQETALRLGVALHGSGKTGEALKVLRPLAIRTATGEPDVDARLLAAFAFIAATASEQTPNTLNEVKDALKRGAMQQGTRGGALAAIYAASVDGKVPFDQADRLFKLERDLLFTPSNCVKRLEVGWMLRRFNTLSQAVDAGKRFLTNYPFDCTSASEKLSGMGQHWLDHSGNKEGKLALGPDHLLPLSDIRQGLKAAAYANWDIMTQRGDNVSQGSQYHVEAFEALEHIERTSSSTVPPTRCAEAAPPVVTRPPIEDELGCPEVKPSQFESQCLKKHRPCVLRKYGSGFLQKRSKTSHLQRWVNAGGNASVHVAFPFPAADSESSPTLNGIEKTPNFVAQEHVQRALNEQGGKEPNATALPWTLVRPGRWHMRFRDFVRWIQEGRQETYMNQQMLVDFGSSAVSELRTPAWVEKSGLTLLSPSLWLSSTSVTTGYHHDAPENLLVQLTGSKEVVLLRPSESDNLYYMEALDVESKAELNDEGAHVSGVGVLSRTSSGHSVINVASPSAAARFPRYKRAKSVRCHIEADDVLYIPAFWHHAVGTTPDESCTALSLNLWYVWPGKPQSFEDAFARWGGDATDLLKSKRDWT